MITSSEGISATSDRYQAINNMRSVDLPEGFKGVIVRRDLDSLMRGRRSLWLGPER